MDRYLKCAVEEDLNEKMVFIGGPRQVGKTTLALDILNSDQTSPAYLNWDLVSVKKTLLKGEIPSDGQLLVFDEIHKYKNWRNLIKGFYDSLGDNRKILVTGSARLDYYRRGGDSLQGRYHYLRLHPLSLYEIRQFNSNVSEFKRLMDFGGFPEPFLKADKRHWRRWQKERRTRVVQEDLVSLEQVKEISQLGLLAEILPERVGSVLSINNLRSDLVVAFETAERWVTILENIYYCFRIAPYGLPALRTAKKEKKLYLWDWSLCESESARFENLVASNLLKYCHYLEDTEGYAMRLLFLRDSTGREIDFVVTRNGCPEFAVECKTGDSSLSKNITYFAARSNVPVFYQVHMGCRDYEVPASKGRVLPFGKFAELIRI